MRGEAVKEKMAMISEANWKATRCEVAGRRRRGLARTARLCIVTAALLIFTVLPLQAQTEKVLHSFAGPPAEGGSPSGSLLRDGKGNLYGTTQTGGASGSGTVFEMALNLDGSYTESVLYSFGAKAGDGQVPVTGLVIDGSGKLYGTTQSGGTSTNSTNCSFGCGTVFMLDNSSGSYKYSQMYSFTGSPDGESPGALLIDSHGNLYGTTEFGGTKTANCKSGCGTVFKLANNSGSYAYGVLYSFGAKAGDGINPLGHLAIDLSGNLYGTAASGGGSTACALGCGIVFELVSSGSYTPSVLHSFTGGSDGEIPSDLVMDAHGNLFGTAENGGSTACPMGCGTVFELTNNSGSYSYTGAPLYSFTGSPDAKNPGSLVIDALGNLFGTAGGGASTACIGCGTVFELANNSGSYTYTGVLYSFTGSPDGAQPGAGLLIDAFGDVYGTTVLGGTSTVCSISGCGTVFEIAPGPAGPAYVFSATTGSGQSATVNTPFASQLGVTVLDANGNPPLSAVTVTFTAGASAGGASGTFANGTATTTAPTIAGVATATVFTADGTVGSYTVTATAPHVTGTASFTLTNTVAQINTTITLSTSSSDHGTALPSNDALVGNPIAVSFKVVPASGSITPTGNVVVTDGLGDTCTQSPVVLTSASNGGGSCTLTIATLPASGSATLTATYTPDTNSFAGSMGTVNESVVEIFACGPSIPEQTVKQGATITYSFTVCVAGNANAVPIVADVVACVPRGKCTLAITQMGQTGVYTVSVTIVTTCGDCKTLMVPQPRSWPRPWPLTLFCFGALLAMLMACQLEQQNRARPRLLYAAGFLFAVVLGGMSGCSSSSSSSNDTPVGVYAVSVKAVAGNFNVVVPVNVMVEK